MKFTSQWTPKKIKAFRATYTLTQANLALLIGAPQQRVGEWEHGTHEMKRPYSKLMDLLEEKIRPIKTQAGTSMEKYKNLVMQTYGVEIYIGEKK